MSSFRRLNRRFAALTRKVKDPLVPIAVGVVLLLVAGALLIRDVVDSSGPDPAEASELTVDEPPTADELRPVTAREEAAVVVPEGMEGVALTLPFTAGGAGYVGVGDRVKVYAVIDSAEGTRLVLVDTGVKVLDVSTEIAPYAGSVEPRPAGSNLTLLLALEPEVAAGVMLVGADATFHLSLMDSEDAPDIRSGTLTLHDYLSTLGPSLTAAAELDNAEPAGENP